MLKADEETPDVSTEARQYEGLVNTVEGFGACYKQMATSVLQTQSMVRKMNAMLERFVQNSLVLQIRICPAVRANNGVLSRVSLTLTNTGIVEVTDMSLNISTVSPGEKETVLDVTYQRTTESDDHISELCLHQSSLSAKQSWKEDIYIRAPCLQRYNLMIATEFPSPSTGQMLTRTDMCGLGVLDQAILSYKPRSANDTDSTESVDSESHVVEIAAHKLRAMFKIAPMEGIQSGCDFVADWGQGDGTSLRLRCLGPGQVAGSVQLLRTALVLGTESQRDSTATASPNSVSVKRHSMLDFRQIHSQAVEELCITNAVA